MIDLKSPQMKVIALGSLLSLVGSGIFFTMPGYLGAVASTLHLSPERIGLLSGAENSAIAISGLMTSFLLTKVGWKTFAGAAALCAIGILLSGLTDDFHMLLAYRFLTGFGEGPLYAMSYVVLGMTANPDRAFGIALMVTVSISAAVLGAPAPLLHQLGTNALLLPTVLAAFILVPTLRWLPNFGGSEAAAAGQGDGDSLLRSTTILLGMAIWFAAPGLFWAFAQTSAVARGVSETTIGVALSLATITSLIGPAIPALVGNRLGRIAPFLLCTIGLAVSAIIYPLVTGLTGVALVLSLFNICWTGATVYQMAMMVTSVQSGRLAGVAAIAQLAGIAVGSLVGGVLIGALGYDTVPIGVAAFVCVGTVLLLLAILPSRAWTPNAQGAG